MCSAESLPNYLLCCRTWVTFCMQIKERKEHINYGQRGWGGYLEWRDTIVAVRGGWRRRWQPRRFSFLLSCLLCFSSQPSSVFFFPPSSSLFLLCLFVAIIGGWRWRCQWRSGGVLWRWRGRTVAAVVFILLRYFFYFFLCHFPFFPASLLAFVSLLCLPQKRPPFHNTSVQSFPAFSSLFFPLFFFRFYSFGPFLFTPFSLEKSSCLSLSVPLLFTPLSLEKSSCLSLSVPFSSPPFGQYL